MNDKNQQQPPLPTLLATPRRPALLAEHDNTLEVLARLQARDVPAELPQRNPLHLSLVIDRSGSMSGRPLAVLPASAFGAISDDELVLRRMSELEAADLRVKARRAAMAGDWDTVMRLLRKAEKLGVDNPWIAAVVVELRQLAERRDEAMFAKASAYGSQRMQSRLAAREEIGDASGTEPATYLRRKSHQGRGDGSAKPSSPRS